MNTREIIGTVMAGLSVASFLLMVLFDHLRWKP